MVPLCCTMCTPCLTLHPVMYAQKPSQVRQLELKLSNDLRRLRHQMEKERFENELRLQQEHNDKLLELERQLGERRVNDAREEAEQQRVALEMARSGPLSE